MTFSLSRRQILAASGAGLLAALPGRGVTGLAFAASDAPILIVVHQRGACDGLNLISPADDPRFIAARVAELRVAADGADAGHALANGPAGIDFRLHPAAAALAEIYQSGNLAFIPAVGITDANRSHFVATDMMERGVATVPDLSRTGSGWLSRYLKAASPEDAHTNAIRSVCAGNAISGEYADWPATVAVPNLDNGYSAPGGAEAAAVLKRLYGAENSFVGDTARRTLASFDTVDHRLPRDAQGKVAAYTAENGGAYEKAGAFGAGLKTIARLIKMDVGLTAASVDIGGWDTHDGQPGRFKSATDQLSSGLGTFWNDLAAYHDRITIVMMTEFGRRLRGNRSTGTDHGRASVMAVMGGRVAGGRILGVWPGLEPEQLEEGVDLAVRTDYRSVLSEVLEAHGGKKTPAGVFAKFNAPTPLGLFASL